MSDSVTIDERLRRLESLQRDTDAEMGHRIEMLREKVEALERRCASIAATASIAVGTISDRLDAALLSIGTAHNEAASDRALVIACEKRIDELELVVVAALKRIDELERRPLAGGGLEFRDRHQGLEFR